MSALTILALSVSPLLMIVQVILWCVNLSRFRRVDPGSAHLWTAAISTGYIPVIGMITNVVCLNSCYTPLPQGVV
jgi:hypothetical protein